MSDSNLATTKARKRVLRTQKGLKLVFYQLEKVGKS